MVQCKFRLKITISVIFKMHVCLHWGGSRWGDGLLPFLLPTLSGTENPCIKGSVRETRPSNSALNCKEFTFYICQNLVMFKLRAKSNVHHQKRPSPVLSICAIVSAAYRPQEIESIPTLLRKSMTGEPFHRPASRRKLTINLFLWRLTQYLPGYFWREISRD